MTTVTGSGQTTVLRTTTRVVRTVENLAPLPAPNDMKGRRFQPTRLIETLHESEPHQDVRRPEAGAYSVEADGPILNGDGEFHRSQSSRIRWSGTDMYELVDRAGMPEAFLPYLIDAIGLASWEDPR